MRGNLQGKELPIPYTRDV